MNNVTPINGIARDTADMLRRILRQAENNELNFVFVVSVRPDGTVQCQYSGEGSYFEALGAIEDAKTDFMHAASGRFEDE